MNSEQIDYFYQKVYNVEFEMPSTPSHNLLFRAEKFKVGGFNW